MTRCLQLALLGLGNTAPNPMVGCVIVYNRKIIGEGYHQNFGGPHAEVNAINSVKDKTLLPESTLYVSLEPCNHFGKTPPCTDLIVSTGIKKVVVGCIDPFDKVSGSGIERLITHNIEVIQNVMEEECKQLNKRFFTFHQQKRPYIILKWAQSADGFIAPVNQTENNRWISNAYSQKLVHRWRSQEQAILVGANTAFMDNPKLNVRSWYGKNPLRILIDKDLKTPSTHYIFKDGESTLVFCNTKIKSNAPIYSVNINFAKDVIAQVTQELYKRNIQSVIVEGGSFTLQHFINANKWDEARVFVAQEKYLNEGIPSPDLKLKPRKKETIANDLLLTFINPNA